MLEKLEEIRESIFKYLEARIELFKLETRSQVENIALNAVHGIVLGFLITITTIFLFSLLAAYLNEVLDSRYLGFLIVAGFFLLLTLIWAFAKGSIENMLRKMTYNIIKNQQEKKAEERAEAIDDLMTQTRESLRESGPLKE
ncbi:phage holin family protein [Larkinella insperata]|uniref:Phage holin family protein n=1 Tax=Larkinella insperata TaxID=332158 RepID=A0ABW3QCW3_9BACT|nr:phage holin family protein [Larkinella insperata]